LIRKDAIVSKMLRIRNVLQEFVVFFFGNHPSAITQATKGRTIQKMWTGQNEDNSPSSTTMPMGGEFGSANNLLIPEVNDHIVFFIFYFGSLL
jgi:hypothetical protein